MNETRKHAGSGLVLQVTLALALAALTANAVVGEPLITSASRPEVSAARRLDIGIRIFDPGLPKSPDALRELAEDGSFPFVRRAEARYIPLQLQRTLERSGLWGRVRVVPQGHVDHITIAGTIRSSTGRRLKVKIRAWDDRGKVFLNETYTGRVSERAYGNVGYDRDPFQPLYNEIANDLLKKREKKSDRKIALIRDLRDMRFAASILPEMFSSYVAIDRKGRFELQRLPARDDPMMARIAQLRLRDDMFIDTVQAYHQAMASEIRAPYDGWREASYAHERLAKQARRDGVGKGMLGVGLILGGIIAADALDDDDDYDEDPEAVLVAVAAAAVAEELFKSAERQFSRARWEEARLRELGAALDSAIAPSVLWVDGEQLRLEGTMEAQYSEWSRLLRQMVSSLLEQER